ncbi:MAG: pectin acetylesterase-family hydrolase [Xanthomonadales bacterium]|nr:pectin acetylesterase-family hydrolase [Xanthomonadales bacterium]
MKALTTSKAFGLAASLVCATAMAGDWETIYPGGEASCANGEDYRFYVRRASTDKVMVYFNGGGACWDGHTCDPAHSSSDMNKGMIYRTQPTAEYGNHPEAFDGAFDLENPDNPFQDWTQVFVTYCTGDVHLGNRDTVYQKADGSEFTIRHRGRTNAQSALDHVRKQFPDPEKVFVSGGSAGGIAAPFYAAELAGSYPEAEILHFSGGSTGYRFPGAQTALWKTWGMFNELPQWFDTTRYQAGNTRIIDLYYAASEAHPRIRFHQYDSAYDKAQTMFVKLLGEEALLYFPLKDNHTELKAGLPYLRSYTTPGNFHTLLRFNELYTREVSGTRALDWINAILSAEEMEDVSCGNSAQCR